MEPTNRQAKYGRKNDSNVITTRIVSVPNGLWQAQRLSNTKPSNTNDPWEPINRPTDYNTACLQAQVEG